MSEIAYPKIKYQGVEIKPGQHHTENPGYIYQRVNNPDDEAALEGDWHDSPREAIDTFKANVRAAAEQRKTEQQELQARERGIPPAGGDGGGAPDMPGDKPGVEGAVEKKGNGTDHEGRPRATGRMAGRERARQERKAITAMNPQTTHPITYPTTVYRKKIDTPPGYVAVPVASEAQLRQNQPLAASYI